MQDLRGELLETIKKLKKNAMPCAPFRRSQILPHMGWLWLLLIFSLACKPSLITWPPMLVLAFFIIPLYTMACYIHKPTRRAQGFPQYDSVGGLIESEKCLRSRGR